MRRRPIKCGFPSSGVDGKSIGVTNRSDEPRGPGTRGLGYSLTPFTTSKTQMLPSSSLQVKYR
jgi:hypothetical protein